MLDVFVGTSTRRHMLIASVTVILLLDEAIRIMTKEDSRLLRHAHVEPSLTLEVTVRVDPSVTFP